MSRGLPIPEQWVGTKDPSGKPRKTEVLFIVYRDNWEAKPQRSSLLPVPNDFNKISLNFNVGSPPCTTQLGCERVVRQLQEEAFEAGQPDIDYNFLVGNDGRVYEGRGWLHQASFRTRKPPAEFPAQTLDIGMIGNYVGNTWPYSMMHSALRLILYGVQEKFIHPTYYYI